MHSYDVKPRIVGPVTVKRERSFRETLSGEDSKTLHETLEDAILFYSPRFLHLSEEGVVLHGGIGLYNPRRLEFIDGCGDTIPSSIVMEKVLEAVAALPKTGLGRWLASRKVPDHRFRRAPVPYTRKRRGGSHYFRSFSTFQECREAVSLEFDEDATEAGVRVRAKRNCRNLPNSWDDYGRGDYAHRSWKRQRRTRWRETGGG